MNDFSALKDLIETLSKNHQNLYIALMTVIGLNILLEAFKLFGMYQLSKKEKSNRKQLIIDEKRIIIAGDIYRSIDALSSKNNITELDDAIKKIRQDAQMNRLYLSKDLFKIITECLDYFTTVVDNYPRNKSVDKEKLYKNRYYETFNR
ncbi:MAG: hypothetical protein MUC49_09640 [Raineya sp.]|jgi:hypothetical protein|nr:hypothetical protein [Raineya sp.]